MRKLLLILLFTLCPQLAHANCAWSDDPYDCRARQWERRQAYERERWYRQQDYYREVRRERRRERRHEERREEHRDHERCKPHILFAVGDADHLKESAKRSAVHAWQAQVLNLYGERYMDYEAAKILDEHWDIAGLGADVITNTKRYVITAAPCLRNSNSD